MTAVAWPASLPDDFLDAGYTESPGENVLREEMDVGPSKTRRRATVKPVQVTGTIMMTRDQFKIWQDFYTDVLFHGTVPFAQRSLDGTLREMYVVERPTYSTVDIYVAVGLTCEFIP